MNIKNGIKNGWNKAKNFAEEHRTVTMLAGAIVASIGGIAITKRLWRTEVDEIMDAVDESKAENGYDFGRDCTIKFIVDETGECLGESKCTESYALEEIDIFNSYQKEGS